jgi:hypothetical protein
MPKCDHCVRWLGIVFALTIRATVGAAQVERSESAENVRAAARDYVEMLPRIQGTSTDHSVFAMPDGGQLIETRHETYKQNAASALLIERVERGQSTTETAYCFNPKYSFILKRKEKGWLLDYWDLENPSKLNYGVGKIESLKDRLQHSLSLPYPHEIRDAGMRLLKSVLEGDLMRIDYERSRAGKAPITSKGAMWFDVKNRQARQKPVSKCSVQRPSSSCHMMGDWGTSLAWFDGL